MSAQEPKLLLYARHDCPFCQKVFAKLEALGQRIPTRDIVADENAAKELIAVGGKRQVPCLVIDGKPMYESEAIIRYLDNRQTN